MTRCRVPSVVVLAIVAGGAWASAVGAQPADGAYRGFLAVRMTDEGAGEVVASLHPDRFFVPASVLKLVTVAAAVERLGADHRWRTRVMASGATTAGRLDGDLIVEPGVDPTWNTRFFDRGAADPIGRLAAQVRASGIVQVTGDLRVDLSRFPGRRHPLDRQYADLPYRFGTPPSPLAVDDGTITIRVAPAVALGEPARANGPPDLDLVNRTVTVGRDRHGAGTLDLLPVWDTDLLVLRGEYPISEPPFVLAASDPSPVRRAGGHLRAALAAAGVRVDGRVRLDRDRRPPAGVAERVVAEIQSPPLAALLPRILVESHNWSAEMLVLTLASDVAGSGRFDDGVAVVADFANGLLPLETRHRVGPRLRDGSGLSSANLVTPAAIVRVLAAVGTEPWGRPIVDAMATPGEGTLARWPRLPALAAKTGTLRHTVALAGVLDPGGPRPIVFCYVVNHHPGSAARARLEIAAALERWATE